VITADQVVAALSPVLDDLVRVSERVRVVGIASSALRGIVLPVGDVDILARDRATVDELVLAFGSPSATVIETPFGHQYLADHIIGGASVQVSTDESTASGRRRLAECVGDTPWRYYTLVDVAGQPIPVVASELRLASDLMRGRPDRWRPIAAHLRTMGFDVELLSQAVLGFPQPMLDELQHALSG
jgi:hypothetical protein